MHSHHMYVFKLRRDAVPLLQADRDSSAGTVLFCEAHVDTDGHNHRCCHRRERRVEQSKRRGTLQQRATQPEVLWMELSWDIAHAPLIVIRFRHVRML